MKHKLFVRNLLDCCLSQLLVLDDYYSANDFIFDAYSSGYISEEELRYLMRAIHSAHMKRG